ncbi:MAG: histidine ammonia-lyase [Saprospiraceae bacterium]|nr:histidine ammonia-lyase [Saprospiraceae bacterium]MDW8484830.1 histidine ammonia-lyase [Saprospiraceae bacterium]
MPISDDKALPVYSIGPDSMDWGTVEFIFHHHPRLVLSEEARRRIHTSYNYLQRKLADTRVRYYGINTGFGALCNVRISERDIGQLQKNLLLSHAAGVGEAVPLDIVRLMLVLKIKSLSYGHSAVREIVVERLIDFFNEDVLPVVPEQGSLGASGDLAPLAHMCLPLAGLGEVWFEGKRLAAQEVLSKKGWSPLTFQAKEALALLNGTQFSTAYAVWCLLESRRLLELADLNAAIGYEAFLCQQSPLDERLYFIRPHPGQLVTARNIRHWLEDSDLAALPREHVQDPYSFRCVPQVHGASRDALKHVEQVVLTEINSVTDNPNVFPESDAILSGGNFHAQPIALALDYLSLALSEIGSIAERRVFQLLSGQRGLPVFLSAKAGLNSGMMIAQYTAAALASQNKTLCMPASADNIVSSNGQEDHVSMAANAGTKAMRIVRNTERLLAIEFMVAMQALDFRLPVRSSTRIEALRKRYREIVPHLEEDRILSPEIEQTANFLKTVFHRIN